MQVALERKETRLLFLLKVEWKTFPCPQNCPYVTATTLRGCKIKSMWITETIQEMSALQSWSNHPLMLETVPPQKQMKYY